MKILGIMMVILRNLVHFVTRAFLSFIERHHGKICWLCTAILAIELPLVGFYYASAWYHRWADAERPWVYGIAVPARTICEDDSIVVSQDVILEKARETADDFARWLESSSGYKIQMKVFSVSRDVIFVGDRKNTSSRSLYSLRQEYGCDSMLFFAPVNNEWDEKIGNGGCMFSSLGVGYLNYHPWMTKNQLLRVVAHEFAHHLRNIWVGSGIVEKLPWVHSSYVASDHDEVQYLYEWFAGKATDRVNNLVGGVEPYMWAHKPDSIVTVDWDLVREPSTPDEIRALVYEEIAPRNPGSLAKYGELRVRASGGMYSFKPKCNLRVINDVLAINDGFGFGVKEMKAGHKYVIEQWEDVNLNSTGDFQVAVGTSLRPRNQGLFVRVPWKNLVVSGLLLDDYAIFACDYTGEVLDWSHEEKVLKAECCYLLVLRRDVSQYRLEAKMREVKEILLQYHSRPVN